jgi:hypothetical protein
MINCFVGEMFFKSSDDVEPTSDFFSATTEVERADDISAEVIYDDDISAEVIDDDYLLELLASSSNSKAALSLHLENRPKCMTVSYDNIDGNAKSNDFVLGDERENSYHWCSSVIFEDVVSANEISDSKVQPSILEIPAEVRMCVTPEENEHLLQNYTIFVMHLIKTHWPKLFPTMKSTPYIEHQYTKLFNEGVNCWVGPLVFEDESTIGGISKVITELIDQVCPKSVDQTGRETPVHPTVFSGDNKTEKMARSAQLALAENGSMRERLGKPSFFLFSYINCN